MPYGNPIPAIDAALRAVMVASAPLTALIRTKPAAKGGGPAIYADGEVAQGQTFPYITIGAWTAVKDHRFSPGVDGYGWNCTGQIKAVGQTSEAALHTVLNEVMELFPDGSALTVTGYGSAFTEEFNIQPSLKEVVQAITTYSVPAIIRVRVQS